MPIDFIDKHYVPILKTKQGERWSISTLSPQRRAHMTPLFEIHAHKTLGATVHASAVCEELVADWGTDDEFFLDTRWLHSAAGNPAIMEGVFESARDNELSAIPVATVDYDATAREQLAAILEADGLGCMIRIKPGDLQSPDEITSLVQDLGIPATEIHLLLDYRSAGMNLAFDLARIPDLASWRTFTSASGSFPRSLLGQPIDEWFELPRLEWTAWKNAIAGGTLARKPSFGDYSTRDPGAPASGGKASVNLRYTREDDWLVRLGGRLEDGAAPQMRQFCELLVAHESYLGAEFSAGDAEIFNKTLPDTGTGGPGDWAKWAISHHLAFVTDQISAD